MRNLLSPSGFLRALLPVICVLTLAAPQGADARQMDPKAVAGIPLPVPDVAVGTVVVRVIKGSLTNNVPNQQVELLGAGAPRAVATDAGGRAQFSGLAPGTMVTATATVGGERLQSQQFAVPANGGTRLLLVATDPAGSAATPAPSGQGGTPASPPSGQGGPPAQAGTVSLNDQSRFVFEFGDSSISVFNLLQIVNTSAGPVMPARPVVFELPASATGPTILKDSSPQATVASGDITVAGPFAPGVTEVQFAYSMPYASGSLTIEQKLPLALPRVIVLAQKQGDMQLESPQMAERREMPADGQMYIVGQGPALKEGERISFAFTNLPHAPLWPRYVAIGIAVVILIAGVWASMNVKTARSSEQERLEKRRGHLFAELAALEEKHRAGTVEASVYSRKRAELVAALERVYAEIDRQAA